MKVSGIMSDTGHRKPNNNFYVFEEMNGARLIVNIEDSMVKYFESYFSNVEDMTIQEAVVYLDTMGLKRST